MRNLLVGVISGISCVKRSRDKPAGILGTRDEVWNANLVRDSAIELIMDTIVSSISYDLS